MGTLGVFTLSMVITVPNEGSDRSRTKHVTLARYHGVTFEESHELKEKFLRTNDELVAAFIAGKWSQHEYI